MATARGGSMSLKVVERENGFTVTEIEFQQKQRTWVCTGLGELASFMLGYYGHGNIYATEMKGEDDEED